MGELLKTNMNDIYRRLVLEGGSVFPEVLIFKKTDFKGRIARYRFNDGRSIIYLKHGKNDAECLIDEILNTKAPVYEAEDWMYHSLSDDDYSRLVCVTLLISEILNINCPQVELRTHMNDLGYSNYDINSITLNVNGFSREYEGVWVKGIAHELRHLWQHQYHPECLENYIHGNIDKDKYLNHVSELDAEAFANKLMFLITGIDATDSYTNLDESIKEKVKERMNTIKIEHSNVWNLKGFLGFIEDDM